MKKILSSVLSICMVLVLFEVPAFGQAVPNEKKAIIQESKSTITKNNQSSSHLFKFSSTTDTQNVKQDEILIQYKDNYSTGKSFGLSASSDIKERKKLSSRIEKIKVSDVKMIDELIEKIKKDTSVMYVEKNRPVKMAGTPTDYLYQFQWALTNINAAETWDILPAAQKPVVVAVIDSGIDLIHEDLIGASFPGFDFVNIDPVPDDENGHGTNVSGIIAANTNNGLGISSVTGNLPIRILPLKVLDANGEGWTSDIVAAIDYAIALNVDIINLSLGSYGYSAIENDAVQRAVSKGIIVIAASGNDDTSLYFYPASYNNVISVGAIDENEYVTLFSNYGDKLDVVAPGDYVITTDRNNNFTFEGYPRGIVVNGQFLDSYYDPSGTSFSAPVVSGIAAVLKAINPALTPLEIENILKKTAIDIEGPGKDIFSGYGMVNMYNAVRSMVPLSPTNPVVKDTLNKFGWTYVPGYASPTYYEYSMDRGLTWVGCTSNPQIVPDGDYNTGDVQVRVKANPSLKKLAGTALLSNAPFTANPVVSFSFDGDNKGKLVGIKSYMEYSLDGGRTYNAVISGDMTLTEQQINTINATTDIKVRVKATSTDAAGPIQNIDILPGAVAPNVIGNDSTNTVVGMDNSMEFSKDNKLTWTRYTDESSLGDMRGNYTFYVRKYATGVTAAGQIKSLVFTSKSSITANTDGQIIEGQEDGEIITVNLIEASYIDTIDPSKITLTGLPAGVTRGEVTRVDDDTITVALSGNSTVDYDAAKIVTMTVDKSQITPLLTANLTTTVSLPAVVEPAPAAPSVGFSFDGVNAGKLMGIDESMEYSIDGGKTFKTATEENMVLSQLELNKITAALDIKVRVKATLRVPVGAVQTINILAGPAVPSTVVGNDAQNTVAGMTTAMEFSKDNGVTWTKYVDEAGLGDMRGTFVLKVRIVPTGLTMGGAPKSITFTAKNPLIKIVGTLDETYTEGQEDGKLIKIELINGTYAESIDQSKITLTGLPTGVTRGEVTRVDGDTITVELSGNSTVDYDAAKVVTVTVDKSQITPLLTTNLTTKVSLPAVVETAPVAPSVSFSFDGSDAGKLMGIDESMEYSIDGGKTYKTATEEDMVLSQLELSKITATLDIKVRVKATLRVPVGAVQTINILAGPAVPNTVVGSDVQNTVTGMTTAMEFSKDNGVTWTKYVDEASLGDMRGTFVLKVRIVPTGLTMGGAPKSITFTAKNPLIKITGVLDGAYAEGQEDGKLITVDLTNGTYIDTIDPSKITLTGLPTGVTREAVTRLDDDTLTVELSGNSIVDYDAAKVVTVTVDKSQITPLLTANLTTTVSLPAVVETAPVAPSISFYFDGVNAGKLMGITNLMEYSINGGSIYQTASGSDIELSQSEISKITATLDIKVRVKATLREPVGAVQTINILAGAAVPSTVVGNDAQNTVTGMTTAMEFSKNNGVTWTKYVDEASLGDMRGSFALKVRNMSTGLTTAGAPKSITFTATNPLIKIVGTLDETYTEGQEDGKLIKIELINGTYAESIDQSKITLTGLPTGVTRGEVTRLDDDTLTVELSGNSIVDYDTAKVVTVTVNKSQITPLLTANLTTTVSLPATKE